MKQKGGRDILRTGHRPTCATSEPTVSCRRTTMGDASGDATMTDVAPSTIATIEIDIRIAFTELRGSEYVESMKCQ